MSQTSNVSGRLVVVASPIGNLEDITLRALRELRTADVIAVEDTRRARKLLSAYEIKTPLATYHKDNEHRKCATIVRDILAGRTVALMTDAGTPTLSDPGFLLLRTAIAQGIEPEVIPGPSALMYAVVACGFPVNDFFFAGFLPRKKNKRRILLRQIASRNRTFFLFESPYRIHLLLAEIAEELSPLTPVVLIREATKHFGEHIRGAAGELRDRHEGRVWKGEFTIAVTTASAQPDNDDN